MPWFPRSLPGRPSIAAGHRDRLVMQRARVCLALLLAAPLATAAPEKRYDVEVVVFARTDTAAAGADERWPARIFAPRFQRAVTPPDDGGVAPVGDSGTARERDIGLAEVRLSQAVERLRRDGDYRVLRHLSWRQPGHDHETSVPLRVSAGEPITIDVPSRALRRPVPSAGNRPASAAEGDDNDRDGARADVDPADESAAREAGSASAETAPAAGRITADTPFGAGMITPRRQEVAIRPLDGTVELIVSRYLHLHFDLFYTIAVDETLIGEPRRPRASASEPGTERESAPARSGPGRDLARGPGGQPMLAFPLRQQRRMRSGDLHYIDHPVLGVLVLVTPVEEDDEEPAAPGA